jgi:Fur family ferric uptake transcriptional regulator
MPVSDLTKALQQQGVKMTRSRMAVLNVLAATSEHLKVAEVHRRARRLEVGIGLASVYRTMDLLARLRLVKHVHVEHRHRHYARMREEHGHHLVCNGCGLVVEFSDCRLDRLTRSLARRTKFRIEGHCMDFFGRCQDCHRKQAVAPGPRRRKS